MRMKDTFSAGLCYQNGIRPEAAIAEPENVLPMPRRAVPQVAESAPLPTPRPAELIAHRLGDLDSQRARARRLRVGATFEISDGRGEQRLCRGHFR